MSDLLHFSRKIGDEWTVQDCERIKEFIPKYRARCSFKSKAAAANDIITMLRGIYPDYSPDKRNDNALKARIELLDKVLAGEVDERKLMSYDEEFYGKLPRDSIY
ncbi:hypothetical protein [Neobacillus soli]|uniref:hypothetical protein n=1 Tax=Neobacillus soli TaxID=220688 RepID=UPI000826B08F|nr:hypothetical protein [Neobacillus soli]